MYHRVLPKEEAIKKYIEPGMFVTADTFKIHLQYIQKHFEPVPLSQKVFDSSFSSPRSKPLCILTFDDGWVDFYNFAFPLLKAHNIPATVFLPTRYIGSNEWFWTDKISYLLAMRRTHTPNNLPNILADDDDIIDQLAQLKGDTNTQIHNAIQLLKPLHRKRIDDIIEKLVSRWGIDANPPGQAFLSWIQIKEMVESGLIFFGSHTADHNILTTLSKEDVRLELEEAKEKLLKEQVVNPLFIPFCYPNGNYNSDIIKMVKSVGYNLAVTTKPGWSEFNKNRFTLKRIPIHQDMTSTAAMLECKISGIF